MGEILDQLTAAGRSGAAILAGENPVSIERQPRLNGYAIGDRRFNGRALLLAESGGAELVTRLKDGGGAVADEVRFWARQLARLVVDPVDLVSHPPSSGKRPTSEHLATILAGYVAWELGVDCRQVFVNEHQRGNRGGRVVKLEESRDNPYLYTGPRSGVRLLVVDDVVFTRSTMARCWAAATGGGDSVSFAILYRA